MCTVNIDWSLPNTWSRIFTNMPPWSNKCHHVIYHHTENINIFGALFQKILENINFDSWSWIHHRLIFHAKSDTFLSWSYPIFRKILVTVLENTNHRLIEGSLLRIPSKIFQGAKTTNSLLIIYLESYLASVTNLLTWNMTIT